MAQGRAAIVAGLVAASIGAVAAVYVQRMIDDREDLKRKHETYDRFVSLLDQQVHRALDGKTHTSEYAQGGAKFKDVCFALEPDIPRDQVVEYRRLLERVGLALDAYQRNDTEKPEPPSLKQLEEQLRNFVRDSLFPQ